MLRRWKCFLHSREHCWPVSTKWGEIGIFQIIGIFQKIVISLKLGVAERVPEPWLDSWTSFNSHNLSIVYQHLWFSESLQKYLLNVNSTWAIIHGMYSHRTRLDVLQASHTVSISKWLAKLEKIKSQTTPTACVFYSGRPPLLAIPKIEFPVSHYLL